MIVCIVITDQSFFSNKFLLYILKVGIVAVVLMIVAIPEGLPLAVSIAMALSISRLKSDEILIKNLESIQSAAMLHDLCVGKTGIITKGDLNVYKFQIGDAYHMVHEHQRDDCPNHFNSNLELERTHKDFIIECILNNTDVRIETNDKEFKYEPHGQALEVGLIKFLIDNEIDVPQRLIERNKFNKKIALLPFDQDLKRMTTVREVDDRIVVYSKGAPEFLIPLCDKVLTTNFTFESLRNSQELLSTTISDMAGASGNEPLKVISFAYKEIDAEEYEEVLA